MGRHLCSLACIRDNRKEFDLPYQHLADMGLHSFSLLAFLPVCVGCYDSALADFFLFWDCRFPGQGTRCEMSLAISVTCRGRALHYTHSAEREIQG